MGLHDLLRESQPDPVSGDLLTVQTAENLENIVMILRLDADAVVPYGKYPKVSVRPRGDVDLRRDSVTAVFNRIADQILQNLLESAVGYYRKDRA
jgi:hypothetical protein